MTPLEFAALIVGILVAGVIVLAFLVRERRSSRLRFGIFVERDHQDADDE